MCMCLIVVEGIIDIPIRKIFSKRGAERRIETAEKALQADFANVGLSADLTEAMADLDWCRQFETSTLIATGIGQHERVYASSTLRS